MCTAVRKSVARLAPAYHRLLASAGTPIAVNTRPSQYVQDVPGTKLNKRFTSSSQLNSHLVQECSINEGLKSEFSDQVFSKSTGKVSYTKANVQERKKPKLVIFDKNGTLINFHVNWSPWILKLSKRLEQLTGKSVTGKAFRHLDVCMFTHKVRSGGILGHGTSWQVKRELEDILTETGLTRREAQLAVENCWEDCDTSNPETIKEVADLESIFLKLKAQQIKIAVCTSDTRKMAVKTLQKLNLLYLIDRLICCGDDIDSKPKPSSHNAELICKELGVSPQEAVVIGDTEADVNMGRQAGVGLTIGVLSGIGTRLDLAPYADCVVENIQEAIPIILGEADIQQTSSTDMTVPKVKKVVDNDMHPSAKARLVIFDKDGTLICFHSMWTPWAKALFARLEKATGLSLYHKVMEELGYCHEREKWQPGLLAQGTAGQAQERIIQSLTEEGLELEEAKEVMEEAWLEGDHSSKSGYLKTLADLGVLFRTLQERDIKVAICTADNRHPTEEFLHSHGLTEHVDLLVCGDDKDTVPKPSPHNALKICSTLNVHPSQAVVVGDTNADLGMGRSAGLGATVAVLSGVGEVDDLDPKADHIVSSIENLLPIVLKKTEDQSIDLSVCSQTGMTSGSKQKAIH